MREIYSNKIIINREKLNISILTLVIYLIFNLSYYFVISPLYGYTGFIFEPYPFRVYIGIAIVLLNSLFLLKGSKSDFIYAAHLIFSIFYLYPNIILNAFVEQHWDIIFSILFFLVCLNLIGSINFKIKFFAIKEDDKLPWFFAITLISLIPFLFIYGKHINFANLLFEDSNETRMHARQLATTYTSYTYSWLAKIFIPIGFVYALIIRKYALSLFFLLSIIFLFLTSAHKSVFIGLFAILFFYRGGSLLVKIKYFLLSLIGVYIFSLTINGLFGIHIIESLFIRRVFFLPALLNNYYFNFFQNNYLYFSDSVLRGLIEYNYSLPVNFLIGVQYSGDSATSANNGFISDSYANLGYFGVAIISIFVSIILSLIKSMNISHRFFGIFFVLMSFTMVGSAFFTTLLTHGLIVLLIIGQLFLKETAVKFK
jgi:O-antigen polymerase